MTEDKPLRADARRNRRQVLDSARAAFAAEGLSVPLDEIARRAGVGPGTLYRHFPTKEALFEAVVHDRLRQLVDDAEALGSATDPEAALAGFVEQLVTGAAEKQDLVEALGLAGVDVSAAVAATAAELRDQIGRLLARAQQVGAVRADLTSADLMALLSGLLLALRSRSNHRADPARALSVLREGWRARNP